MTALTDNPAREEEFGTRARVLPLFRCTSALGTQIVAALRLRFRLRKRDVVLKYARSECATGSMTIAIFKHFLTKLPTHLYFDLHFCKVFLKFPKNFLIFLQKTLDTVMAR